MPITQFPLQPKVPLRSGHEQALALICDQSQERVWRAGNRTLLLELTLTLSELKRPQALLIPFPPAAFPNLNGGISDAEQIAAQSRARDRWRAESTCRQKHLAMLAWMRRREGATARDLAELTGWRKQTVLAFVRSRGQKGVKVIWKKDAAGEHLFLIVK